MKKPIPFGKYYLLERINVGGMAEVFRAKAYGVEGFERLVAVKRILPNIAEDKEFIRMFIDEAKIAVQLNHANIAQIFDLGVVDSSYYIALEHIHGRDLRIIFDRGRETSQSMPIAQAAFVMMKVCEGLDYAHNKRDQSGRELNLVHRDVSPQNILVSFEGEVKLIDFGIAKAAGKGAKTQAGILKGKFGYMSPEQVRGLPIDRRSDIFSCGIVLYELLTGERLFVGESDFSTLEKVRNVEILPPSTFNRKIPDELERIVLKALAKDVEDRYQNAIDLHDDLQAFVYTAGEFYSRKDLAASMKKTFAKEIEEETAKLESYRQLRPPESRAATTPSSGAAMRRTSLGAGGKPPPPPIPRGGERRSAAMTVQGIPAAKSAPAAMAASPGQGLVWDDDELETQIYDEDIKKQAGRLVAQGGTDDPDANTTLPLGALSTAKSSPHSAPALNAASAAKSEPDLSALANSGPPPGQPSRPWEVPASTEQPAQFAIGSNPAPSPFGEESDASGVSHDAFGGSISEAGMAIDHVSLPHSQKQSSSKLWLGLSLAALLLIGGGIGAYVLIQGDGDKQQAIAATPDNNPTQDSDKQPADPNPAIKQPGDQTPVTDTQPDPSLSKEILGQTGFNLIVKPKEVTVKLNGKVLDLKPPMKVRNIPPGDYELIINGPPGFFSKTERITVEAGKAQLHTIQLDPLEIIGHFESEPIGADVTLLVDKEQEVSLGKSPAKHKLEPGKSYDVRFEKRGYVTKTAPVQITGNSEERVLVALEKVRGRRPGGPRVTTNTTKKNGKDTTPPDSGKPKDTKPVGKGILMLGAKPVCEIYINGKNTGKKTPQRSLELPAGKHRITLVNNEHGIKEKFTVHIKAGKKTKEIKNFSDRMK